MATVALHARSSTGYHARFDRPLQPSEWARQTYVPLIVAVLQRRARGVPRHAEAPVCSDRASAEWQQQTALVWSQAPPRALQVPPNDGLQLQLALACLTIWRLGRDIQW